MRPAVPLWFLAAFVPMVGSQLLRLRAVSPEEWIAWDYAGRIGAIAILWFAPAARAVAFKPGRLALASWPVAMGILALFAFQITLGVGDWIDARVPHTRLADYPVLSGFLKGFDSIAGVALVAVHEELVFRRCARAALEPLLKNPAEMVVASAILFGAYHWWNGVGPVVEAAAFGALAMIFYIRAGVLWPVVFAHFLVDLVYFGLPAPPPQLPVTASGAIFVALAVWMWMGWSRQYFRD